MIRVTEAPKPPGFDAAVFEPGMDALRELVGKPRKSSRTGPKRKQLTVPGKRKGTTRKVTAFKDIPSAKFPPFWREIIPDLLKAYNRICAYACVYIAPITGSATVDHMVPVSRSWRDAYRWSNYRLACSLMNSRKKDAEDVLDPFAMGTDWFHMELVGFRLKPNPILDRQTQQQIKDTIERLGLNDREFRDAREAYYEAYQSAETSFSRLEREAPHMALEIKRQGQLREEDR